MKTIVVSREDIGGMNIYARLIENFDFVETSASYKGNSFFESKKTGLFLVLIDSLHIFSEHLDELNAEFIIFASRHSSKSGTPTLSVHPVGNWGKAELGGIDCSLGRASAALMKNYLLGLREKRDSFGLKFEVSYEATHHGPFLKTPCCFIEVGSSEKQWRDEKAALAIAETIMERSFFLPCKPVIGVGGLHYNPHFTEIALSTEFAFSHMCPKYALPFFNMEMLEKAIFSSIEKPEAIVVEYKGLGEEKHRILSLLESQSFLPVKRTNEVKNSKK
ncbi:MAG: D-aminoacyl-tRNA deacylase [Candidatus Diapherotrites archaeon]